MRIKPYIILLLLCFSLSTGFTALGHCTHTLQEALLVDDYDACEDGDCDTIEATLATSTNVNKTHRVVKKAVASYTTRRYNYIQLVPPFWNRISAKPGQDNSTPLYLLNRSIII